MSHVFFNIADFINSQELPAPVLMILPTQLACDQLRAKLQNKNCLITTMDDLCSTFLHARNLSTPVEPFPSSVMAYLLKIKIRSLKVTHRLKTLHERNVNELYYFFQSLKLHHVAQDFENKLTLAIDKFVTKNDQQTDWLKLRLKEIVEIKSVFDCISKTDERFISRAEQRQQKFIEVTKLIKISNKKTNDFFAQFALCYFVAFQSTLPFELDLYTMLVERFSFKDWPLPAIDAPSHVKLSSHESIDQEIHSQLVKIKKLVGTGAKNIAVVLSDENKYLLRINSRLKKINLASDTKLKESTKHVPSIRLFLSVIHYKRHPTEELRYVLLQTLDMLDLSRREYARIWQQNWQEKSFDHLVIDHPLMQLISDFTVTKTQNIKELPIILNKLWCEIEKVFPDEKRASLLNPKIQKIFSLLGVFSELQMEDTFLEFICDEIAKLEVEMHSAPEAHVKILNFIDARLGQFDHVFILGCTDQFLPKRKPFNALIPEFYKAELGLPKRLHLQNLEAENFINLCGFNKHVELSFPIMVAGVKTTPTAYLNFLKSPVLETVIAPKIRKTCGSDTEQWFADAVHKLTEKLSATSIQSLISCPRRFFYKKMRLEPFLFFQDQAALKEGLCLHEAAAKIIKNRKNFGNFYLSNQDLGFLKSKYQDVKPGFWFDFENDQLPAFIDFLNERFSLTAEIQLEKKFKNFFDLSPDFREILVEGFVDFVSLEETQNVVIDFKRNSHASRPQIYKGLDLQLAIYGTVILEELGGEQPIQIGYWSFAQKKWTEVFSRKNISAVKESFNLLKWRFLELAETKTFPIDTSNCGFCEYAAHCRKHDQLRFSQLSRQRYLETHLKVFAEEKAPCL